MQLKNFGIDAFKQFENYSIEDMGLFLTMRNRMIESTDIIICFSTMSQGERAIDEALVVRALSIIDPNAEEAIRVSPIQAVIGPRHVLDFARPPAHLEHSPSAIEAIARFLNFYLIKILYDAALAASRDPSFRPELPTIKSSHLFSFCEHLPYPLNLWFC